MVKVEPSGLDIDYPPFSQSLIGEVQRQIFEAGRFHQQTIDPVGGPSKDLLPEQRAIDRRRKVDARRRGLQVGFSPNQINEIYQIGEAFYVVNYRLRRPVSLPI